MKLTGRVSLPTCLCRNTVRHWGSTYDSHTGDCCQDTPVEWQWQWLVYVLAAIDQRCSLRSNDKFQCQWAVHSQCAVENHVCANHPQQNTAVLYRTYNGTLTLSHMSLYEIRFADMYHAMHCTEDKHRGRKLIADPFLTYSKPKQTVLNHLV